MLHLKNIVKVYRTGGDNVVALKGVSLRFRKNEFVSILGQSGCGKTTLLNIIGGLDRYTDGDLEIAGRSTKEFKDSDWDHYRNRSVGFVFQSYHLIPHQTVLSNVELSLTLTGVSKQERRRRAKEVLAKVGLSDQMKKKPNQLSGGQMQRVAIARALINNPEILLADEPTGALDSETSVQIMELLKEVAKERLVIMVTHNPALAEQYSTRIIRLLDGAVVDDTKPYTEEEAAAEAPAKTERKRGRKKKPSMSFWTALSLSVNNLLTKKARTVMTSFAGSIGIIGIALIMSVSGGVQAYIDGIERDTMSGYPLVINDTAMDTSSVLLSLMKLDKAAVETPEENTVYSLDVVVDMMESMTEMITTNNLTAFKEYLESDPEIPDAANDIKYSYATGTNFYFEKPEGGYQKALESTTELYQAMGMDVSKPAGMNMDTGVWKELVGDDALIRDSYKVLYGNLPAKADEAVLIVDDHQQVSDYTLYMLGIRDTKQLKEYLDSAKIAIETNTENEYQLETRTYSFEELCGYSFRVLTDADYYNYNEQTGRITEKNEAEVTDALQDAMRLKIVGIVQPVSADQLGSEEIGSIGYTAAFMEELIARENASPAVKAQKDNEQTDLFTGLPFEGEKEYTVQEIRAYFAGDPQLAQYNALPDETVLQYGKAMLEESRATYQGNLEKLGCVDKNKPSSISIYPRDFNAKQEITAAIRKYNDKVEEQDRINYTDIAQVLVKSVGTIVDAISYVLIAFVAISLIVSSIMIGIITYISVLERIREIGILRAIGASKRDIARVFNAETTIIGFAAGVIGIGVTLLLIIPINMILHSLTGIATLSAALPAAGAVALIVISVLLTFIAGLIPSGYAAKRDPVEALRTE